MWGLHCNEVGCPHEQQELVMLRSSHGPAATRNVCPEEMGPWPLRGAGVETRVMPDPALQGTIVQVAYQERFQSMKAGQMFAWPYEVLGWDSGTELKSSI